MTSHSTHDPHVTPLPCLARTGRASRLARCLAAVVCCLSAPVMGTQPMAQETGEQPAVRPCLHLWSTEMELEDGTRFRSFDLCDRGNGRSRLNEGGIWYPGHRYYELDFSVDEDRIHLDVRDPENTAPRWQPEKPMTSGDSVLVRPAGGSGPAVRISVKRWLPDEPHVRVHGISLSPREWARGLAEAGLTIEGTELLPQELISMEIDALPVSTVIFVLVDPAGDLDFWRLDTRRFRIVRPATRTGWRRWRPGWTETLIWI